jgi:UDP-N-acetylmuramate--alanine ligase
VSGCDTQDGEVLEVLRRRGIEVHLGHDPSHVEDADVVVHSMAVPPDHPELARAHARGAKVLKRIELLGALFGARRTIGITGTHGKSTTTGMAATVLLALHTDPSIHIGARLASIRGNVRFGDGPWMVAEVDESDPGFAELRPAVAVLTNLEDDHIAGEFDERRNYHASLADLEGAARRYAANAEVLLYCADWPGLGALLGDHPHALSYGEHPDAAYRLTRLVLEPEGSRYRLSRPERSPLEVRLAVPGRHNALNAAAALAAFGGVGRRWERWADIGGALIIDDYAHHPTEVAATLDTARATGRRVRAVLQPHRWVRTARHWRALAEAAARADEVLVLDVYSAGETPIPGVSPERIVTRLRELGVRAERHDLSSAERYLAETVQPNDLIITLGAGDVWTVAAALSRRGEAHATR